MRALERMYSGSPENKPESESRRKFLQGMLAVAFCYVAPPVLAAEFEATNKEREGEANKFLPGHDRVFEIMKKIENEFGSEALLQIRTEVLTQQLGIPSGPYSALNTKKDKNGLEVRIFPKGDKLFAEAISNRTNPGVLVRDGTVVDAEKHPTSRGWSEPKEFQTWVDSMRQSMESAMPEKKGTPEPQEQGFYSFDLRDLYSHFDEIQDILRATVSPETYYALNLEYQHMQHTSRLLETGDPSDPIFYARPDDPIFFTRLPGGAEVILRGYNHDQNWQRMHGAFLAEAYKGAKVIAMERMLGVPKGESLDELWTNKRYQSFGHFDVLMRDLVRSGFNGIFTEIDARDSSKVAMERGVLPFSKLPKQFIEKYYQYLQKEHPKLAEKIGSADRLATFLDKQSRAGFDERGTAIFGGDRIYGNDKMVDAELKDVDDFSGMEFGQQLFADALSAIKIHLLGRLMADGKIEKGLIVDIQGSGHLPNKAFFLNEPRYAMEIVLRSIHELMAGHAEKKQTNNESLVAYAERMYGTSQSGTLDWKSIIFELLQMVIAEVEVDPTKTIEPGKNQRSISVRQKTFTDYYDADELVKVFMPDEDVLLSIQKKMRKEK